MFELTASESKSNAQLAEIFGTIVTGLVVAKPIQNAVNNKFGLNVKPSVDSSLKENTDIQTNKSKIGDINRTPEIEIQFNRNPNHDANEFARQLKNQQDGMKK